MTVEEFLNTGDKRTKKYKLIKKYINELNTNMKQNVEILYEYILDILKESD